jgi:hypothetical protein
MSSTRKQSTLQLETLTSSSMYLSVFSVKFCNSDVAITTHKFRDQTDFRIQRRVVRFANLSMLSL